MLPREAELGWRVKRFERVEGLVTALYFKNISYILSCILLTTEGTLLDDEDVTNETLGLTATQLAVVQKRVDTLNATIRKKQKAQLKQKVDVRAVFSNVPQVEMLYKFITTQDLLVVAHANIAIFSNVPQVEMCTRLLPHSTY